MFVILRRSNIRHGPFYFLRIKCRDAFHRDLKFDRGCGVTWVRTEISDIQDVHSGHLILNDYSWGIINTAWKWEKYMPRASLPVSRALRTFVDGFEQQIASLSLAEAWDNVGMLVECPSATEISKISLLTCIDLTNEVVSEAIAHKCNLIVAYHPVLFRPVQSLSMQSQAPILRCVQNGVNVFVPHTALDTAPGGMNDYISNLFIDLESNRTGIKESHITGFSLGRVVILRERVSLADIISIIKSKLSLDRVRFASSGTITDKRISSIAICVGSGSSVLNGSDADLYLTGEMTHHDILAAKASGKSVILLDHSSSERPFLPELAKRLASLGCVESVCISHADVEPIRSA